MEDKIYNFIWPTMEIIICNNEKIFVDNDEKVK